MTDLNLCALILAGLPCEPPGATYHDLLRVNGNRVLLRAALRSLLDRGLVWIDEDGPPTFLRFG